MTGSDQPCFLCGENERKALEAEARAVKLLAGAEAMQEAHEEMVLAIDLANRDLANKRREVAKLKTMLEREREDEPEAARIRSILEFFVQERHKTKAVGIQPGGERWELVRKALKWPSEDRIDQDIMAAIRGIGLDDWWISKGKDDIKHILGSQIRYEGFRDSWYAHDDRQKARVELREQAPGAPLPSEDQLKQWQQALRENDALQQRIHEVRGWSYATLEKLRIGWDGKRFTLPVRNENADLENVCRYVPHTTPKMLATTGRPRGLFPAPESLPRDTMVWFVEGEPDAVTMHELGLQAVALPGATAWHPSWAARFDGRRVTICFDCDEPGRKAADRAFVELSGHAKEIRVVDLDPEKTNGYDVSDFVQAGGTKEDLEALKPFAGRLIQMGLAA